MGKPVQMTFRDWMVTTVGAVLLTFGLLALAFPVFLDDYDGFGVQIKCGTGYSGQLLQATVEDQNQASRTGPGSAPTSERVDQCNNALTHRRAWAIPLAGIGALIFLRKMVRWGQIAAANSRSSSSTWSERPDQALHEAAVLDRRERTYRGPPSNTTL